MDIFIRNRHYTGPLRAVILDWAGTAVDYGSIGPVAVFLDVFEQFGVPVSVAEARRFMGTAKKDHIRLMCGLETVRHRWEERYGRLPAETDVEKMYAETEQRMVAAIARYSDPIPGLLDTVSVLRRQGLRIGSTTGYTGPMMAELVPAAAAKGYSPDAIFCASDVPAGRPYPWMSFKNVIELAVHPLESVVKIGDTISDIHEGLNAGMWTIGLTRSGNELGMTASQTRDLPPEELQTRLKDIARRFFDAGAHYAADGIWDVMGPMEDIQGRLAKGERP
jgi:phosphonoacetaldehyde hydrolase